MTTESIERTMELHAAPERVWRAITEPDELSQWFGQKADGEMRPGGEGWFEWVPEGRFHFMVDVVEPPTRLVWRWGAPAEQQVTEHNATTVEWTLSPRGDGGTTLRLVESGFRRAEDRAENDKGWTEELQELFQFLDADAAGGGNDDDRPDGDALAELADDDRPPLAAATP